jgi:hypothetical protein
MGVAGGAPLAAADPSEARALVESLDQIEIGPLVIDRIPDGAIRVQKELLRNGEVLFDTIINVGLLAPQRRPYLRLRGTGETGSLEGQLRDLKIRCLLGLPPYAPRTRVEIEPGALELEIQADTPSIRAQGGLDLATSQRFIELRSTTGVKVDVNGASGDVELRASNVPVGPWTLRLAAGDTTLSLATSAVMSGQSRWKMALDTGRIEWDRGSISLRDLVIDPGSPLQLTLGPARVEVGKLTLGRVNVRRTSANEPIEVGLERLVFELGRFGLQGRPEVRGSLSAPLRVTRIEARVDATGGELAARDVVATGVDVALAAVSVDDGGGTRIEVDTAAFHGTRLAADDVQASVHLDGGRTSQGVSVHRLDAVLHGHPSALEGEGDLEISADISSVSEISIQNTLGECGQPVRIDIGLRLDRSTARVAVTQGQIEASLHDFSGQAHARPQYYRCEWDHRVGEIPEVRVCVPLLGCAVLSGRRDIQVHWIAELQPTLVDTLALFRAEELKIVRGGPVLCRPMLFVTPNLYAGSVHPNFPDDPILRPFRDGIRLLANGLEGSILTVVTNLGANLVNGAAAVSSPFCAT